MKLSKLIKGQKAVIKEINLPEELKQRLTSLGFVKNEIIKICKVGFLGGSFYIKLNVGSCIMISKNEAEHIEVELIGRGLHRRWGKKFGGGMGRNFSDI